MNKKALGLFKLIFLLSLFFVCFSAYQIYISNTTVNAALEEWEQKKETYNIESPISAFEEEKIIDLHKKDQSKETTILYPHPPKVGEVFGKITIPKINQEFPIIHGTDQPELAEGVGHYIGSVLPGESDNTVLAGHRDTVFKDLGTIETGDMIIVETVAGTFTYKITGQRIVDKDDRTVIVPYDKATLTLITCYPFEFVGPAPERFVLVGELVN
ncbi:LPXTG-site transpeptidase (sortase) family protein [Bacillus mesophilus]|uniref:Class D sortase n=1 Tax=Bacillus mesophilus TaxID=1808955 RepID=A0A6M0Q991_9BACI|nr:class D sortase [Bacillus mesophilus]MBM7661641.1 LPXTG-site transpeptidase (sortase) family protein [Bacillus mesophilus]NEY72309.1 class D sortase [Bacillus mesophilus]